jgi:PhoH-like ATPase
MDDDPGFLLGDLKEKSIPLLAGVTDALIFMHAHDGEDEKSTCATVEHIIDRANIEFTSMAYFRGRSIDDALLIIDEAQNMTRAQMSTVSLPQHHHGLVHTISSLRCIPIPDFLNSLF